MDDEVRKLRCEGRFPK